MDIVERGLIPEDLVEKIAKERCVLFVGAGISITAGLPSWAGFLEKLLDYCTKKNIINDGDQAKIKEDINNELYLEAGNEFRKKMNNVEFKTFLNNLIQQENISLSETHRIIAKFPFKIVLTTNYDNLLEEAYNEAYHKLDLHNKHFPYSLLGDGSLELQENIIAKHKMVLHVHGIMENPDTIVLGTLDYDKITAKKDCNTILQTVLGSNTVFFVGFSLTDPNILLQMEELKSIFGGLPGPHYALMSQNSINNLHYPNKSNKKFVFTNNDNLVFIPYDNNEKDEVKSYLEKLYKKVKGNTSCTLNGTWDSDMLLRAYIDAKFYKLGWFEPKFPVEMIKQIKDGLLKVMSEVAKIPTIDSQLDYIKNSEYTNLYKNSWAEHELQIIGMFILKKLHAYWKMDNLSNFYDAGCGNCGQFIALNCLIKQKDIKQNEQFKYYAQDFNTEWKNEVSKKAGEYICEILPECDSKLEEMCDLICCTHSLHYLIECPLAIYSSFFSFNLLLHNKGYCYITVPDKTSKPGLPDLLMMASRDAGFCIKEHGRYRLKHKISSETRNFTTFYYMILQKDTSIDKDYWKELMGASFFKLEKTDRYEFFKTNSSADINGQIILLEEELKAIIYEKNICIRTFRYALYVVRQDKTKPKLDKLACQTKIENYNREITKYMIDLPLYSCERQYKLTGLCSEYFYVLVRFFICHDQIYKPLNDNKNKALKNNKESISTRIKKYSALKNDQGYILTLNKAIDSKEDILINIKDLNIEQAARLVKHLFEICQNEHIDICKAFRKHMKF